MEPTRIGRPGVVTIRQQLTLPCHPFTCVGEYVPFYFCPRSVMLYVIHCANHPDIVYTEGQRPIVHLEPICMRSCNGQTIDERAGDSRCRTLIERIGVIDAQVAQRVSAITAGTPVRVEVRRSWYY